MSHTLLLLDKKRDTNKTFPQLVCPARHRDQLGEAFSDYDNLVDLARALVERYKETGFARTTRQVRNLLGADELPPLVE